MNRSKSLAGKFGIVLGGVLLGYSTYGQPAVSVGISVPVPSVEVVLPSVEIRAESDFYEPLAPQGEWVVIGGYGRCWRPRGVAVDWRPYCNGNWQRTDAGWYWVSDEPWAWATYHYGRWDFTDQYGWYWVPQIQWAPAWVSWHEGGGYIGWAPLLPGVRLSSSGYVGFNVSLIPSRAYVFVEQRRFSEPIRPTTVIVNNTTIINKTVTINNTKIVNNTVVNEGPATTVIEKASGRHVEAVPVQQLRHTQEARVVGVKRTAATTPEKIVQTPVRNETALPERKAVAARESLPVPKPAVAIPAPVAPAPNNHEARSEKHAPVPAAPELKPEARPEGSHPAPNRPPTEPPVGQHVERHEKPGRPSDKKAQRPANGNPNAGENKAPNPAEKDHEKGPK